VDNLVRQPATGERVAALVVYPRWRALMPPPSHGVRQ